MKENLESLIKDLIDLEDRLSIENDENDDIVIYEEDRLAIGNVLDLLIELKTFKKLLDN